MNFTLAAAVFVAVAFQKNVDVQVVRGTAKAKETGELLEETSTAPVNTFQVKARDSLNDRAVADADRRGWKMFTPKEVAMLRASARTVQDLLRSWGNAGLQFSMVPL